MTSQITHELIQLFTDPQGGVVGLVDRLLAIASQHHLHLSWHDNQCRMEVVQLSAESITFEVPLSKPVFRAILARLAALCNDYQANSVSPYGGRAKLLVPGLLTQRVTINFVNTPAEQCVTLVRDLHESAPVNGHAVPEEFKQLL
jgi:hypothetical protein